MIDEILWKATDAGVKSSNLWGYKSYIEEKYKLNFNSYSDLWKWSVEEHVDFWESILFFFNVNYSGSYNEVSSGKMPDTEWFSGIKLNYAEHFFRGKREGVAVFFQNDQLDKREITWAELEEKSAAIRSHLISKGIKKGDCCAAYLPNIPEALIAFIACCSMGVTWSSCSPDFGVNSVVDRFSQIKPKCFISSDGYYYGKKVIDRRSETQEILEKLPEVTDHISIGYLNSEYGNWNSILVRHSGLKLTFDKVPFAHPIWVLYSSGTTGIPKAITHSQGGILLEHLKYIYLQNEVKSNEKFFWFSTTGWMMWNFSNAALLAGASVVIFDGNPGYPSLNALWEMAAELEINHFGTSAPFLVACMKNKISPKAFDLSSLRSIGSTGAPLPPEAFDYTYAHISPDVWLCSMAGGTDVCTAFVGSNIWSPVKRGKIQGRALGVALYSLGENGTRKIGEVGEMVIEKPMPSMPIYFWNDPKKERYLSSYFQEYEGKWRHGDWIEIDCDGQIVIYGRSDATLNRQGVRIGTSEIYRSVNKIEGIEDSIIVNLELEGGEHFMPLFVKMKKGKQMGDSVKDKIRKQLRSDYSPRHVPDVIIQVPDIPYTMSGKKLETPLKKILLGMDISKAANKEATKNPEIIEYFLSKKEAILAMKP